MAQPTAYTIQINEEQREALLELLSNYPDEPGEPLEYWPDMLRRLPQDEAEHPGILHGFCL